ERTLSVWNKRDLPGALGPAGAVRVSALTGAGMDELERQISRRARPETEEFRLRIPYRDGRSIAAARARKRVLAEEDQGGALVLRLAGQKERLGALRRYLIDESAAGLSAAGV